MYSGYENTFECWERLKYLEILRKADHVVYVNQNNSENAEAQRYNYMIENSSKAIFALNDKKSTAGLAFEKASKKGIDSLNIL